MTVGARMADLGMDWNELTEEELKDELSIRGLDTTGTKEDLVRKIQADETGKIQADETGKIQADETVKIQADETGKIQADETGKTNV